MAAVSLNIAPGSVTLNPQTENVKNRFFSLFKSLEGIVPTLVAQIADNQWQDLRQETQVDSRFVTAVEAVYTAVIQVEHSRTIQGKEVKIEGHQITLNYKQTLSQPLAGSLLSLKTDEEIRQFIISALPREKQEYFQSNPNIVETEEYRLTLKALIEQEVPSLVRLLGQEGAQLLRAQPGLLMGPDGTPYGYDNSSPNYDEIYRIVEPKIKEMFRKYPHLAYAAADHVLAGGRSPMCVKFFEGVIQHHIQQFKSLKDRVKNLDLLFRKVVDNLAHGIGQALKDEDFTRSNRVTVELAGVNFTVHSDTSSGASRTIAPPVTESCQNTWKFQKNAFSSIEEASTTNSQSNWEKGIALLRNSRTLQLSLFVGGLSLLFWIRSRRA